VARLDMFIHGRENQPVSLGHRKRILPFKGGFTHKPKSCFKNGIAQGLRGRPRDNKKRVGDGVQARAGIYETTQGGEIPGAKFHPRGKKGQVFARAKRSARKGWNAVPGSGQNPDGGGEKPGGTCQRGTRGFILLQRGAGPRPTNLRQRKTV